MDAKTTTATATPSTTATTPLGLTGALVRSRALSLCALSVLASSLDLCLLSPTISWAATSGMVLRHACAIRPHQGRSRPYCSVADITILMVAATVPCVGLNRRLLPLFLGLTAARNSTDATFLAPTLRAILGPRGRLAILARGGRGFCTP